MLGQQKMPAQKNIDYKKVKFYIKSANKTGRRKILERPLEVLKKLELIKNSQPTWAARLLFGKNPQAFLPQAKIHCGRFKDEITIIDDKLVEGDLIEQIDDKLTRTQSRSAWIANACLQHLHDNDINIPTRQLMAMLHARIDEPVLKTLLLDKLTSSNPSEEP